MTELVHAHPLYAAALVFIFGFGAVTFPTLFFITAPYGRHQREGWGPVVPARLAWVLMEAPSPIAFAVAFAAFGGTSRPIAWVLLGAYMLHYVDRAFFYPFRMRADGKTKPLLTVVLAFVFNLANGAANGYAISAVSPHLEPSWALDPRFVLGLVVFGLGFHVNRRADAILLSLRRPGETGYRVPEGFLYRWVSCPNYLGEILEWTGFAIASWTLAGAAFLFFTLANLVPRALANHRWYRERFPTYPSERRALIPYVW